MTSMQLVDSCFYVKFAEIYCCHLHFQNCYINARFKLSFGSNTQRGDRITLWVDCPVCSQASSKCLAIVMTFTPINVPH